MSSYYRGHHGRPRPPPARNRPGHQSSSAPPPTTMDPHYLAYLQAQAAQIDSQISALSGRPQVTPSTHAPIRYTQGCSSRHYTNTSRRSTRNPSREGSKWRFYAVKNGLEGDDVYSSWGQAYPYCWNPDTQYFYPGSFCKGFDDYDRAWNFLLGLHSSDTTQTSPRDSIPLEPPEFDIPPEPSSLPFPPEVIPPHDDVPLDVSEPPEVDEQTLATYDYNAILKCSDQVHPPIPDKVSVQDSVVTNTNSTSVDNVTPFLSATSNKALPKYSGKPTEDISEFIYKLKPFLRHGSIDNCHKQDGTNSSNAEQSKNLASLLSMCLTGNAISSFVDNPDFDDKGIEMLNHLLELKHPSSKTSASTIYNALPSQRIKPGESFDEFAKRLRIMYKTCTRSGISHDEGFLIRCFMQGLDSNFDHTREMIDVGALKYYEKTLNEVLVLVHDIKLTKLSHGTWIEETASANATTGQQGARRPIASTTPTATTNSNIPDYLHKTSDLSYREVKMLLERYSCPLCRRNNHALHTCHALRAAYNITLKSQTSDNTTAPNTQSAPANSPQPIAANRATTSVEVITDDAARYDGFESVVVPPSDSDQDNTDVVNSSTTVGSARVSKINEPSNNYSNFFHFKHHIGSVRRSHVTLPTRPACFRISSNGNNEYPIIIDSGATHHMWNNKDSFITYTTLHNCYVTLANKHKIPVIGQGTIQLNIQGYILHLHNVYLVPSLQFNLYSVKVHRRYPKCSCLFDNDAATLNFPKFSFDINDDYDMIIYAKNILHTVQKIHWSSRDGMRLTAAKSTHSVSPPLRLPSHKPNPNKQTHRKITNIDIHKYLGFRTLKKLEPFRLVAKDNVSFIEAGEIPLSHGDFTTIQRHQSNKNAVTRPHHFFDIAHMDITYGDTVAPGGIKFALLVVDRKTRYSFVLPLQDCKSVSITNALQRLKVMAGKLPRIMYTDFDPKLLSKTVTNWYLDNDGMILAAPPEQQHQNGLVERTWQTISQMARAYINDKQMPKSYWYWAIKHASRIHNIFPVKYNDKYTTPYEMVYKDKPDYRQLIRLFSTVYFSHSKDNTKARTNMQAHTLAGIAVEWSDTANGLLVYNPITKELYTTSVYKIDEHNQTKTYFNLQYDGGMFSGLYSTDSAQNIPENYPIGTSVTITTNTDKSKGYVLAVPSHSISDDDPMYTIKLLDGGTTTVPASAMPHIINKSTDQIRINLPSWIQHDSKVRYTIGRVTHQGRLHIGTQNQWYFTVHNKLGMIIKQLPLENLPFTFQTLIDEGVLKPGWENHPQLSAFNVSAKNLQHSCPPTLNKALDPSHLDRDTWLQSYTQEYSDLRNMDVYDEISQEDFRKIQHHCGRPIPTMCVLTVKYKNGYPDRAKCRIVVLGNQQQQSYTKGEKYAPVITQNQFRCLLSLAIKHRRRLRQGDVKNAFCNGTLPDNEVVVVTPPKGCPHSKPNTLWRLRKTLYGLVRSPLHWYKNISNFFKSIGLQNSPNSPCLFHGKLLPDEPPIYVGLYVDDFAFFSDSDAVEERFRTLLNAEYTVSYDESLEWFLGMKFDWHETPDTLKCHVHQEAFILDIVDRHGLTNCNKSTRATPFRSGFPVDNIQPSNLPDNQQQPLTKQFQQLLGDLNWLSISTRPDITAIVSLLSAHSHKPSPAHLDLARHVVKYLASTASFGLYYTSNNTENFHAFVHFPNDEKNALQAYCDANWGPMDASVPKPEDTPVEQSLDSLRSLSGWFIMNAGAPIAWGCARHKDTAQSSCQAEVHSVNETTKLILEYKLLFRDIDLPLQHTVEIKNDNQGAIQWSKGTTTKKMRWVDLRENLVRGNILNKNIHVSHIPGKTNLSDIFTKEFRDVSQFLYLRNLFMISSPEFSTGTIPSGTNWRTSYKDALTSTR